jgi:predicted ester cyclase
MSKENKALGRREIEKIFNGRNLDAAHEFYASYFVDHDRAFSWKMHDPVDMKEYVGVLHSAFPDFHVTLEDQVAEGDKVVNRWRVRVTHQGELQGIALVVKRRKS